MPQLLGREDPLGTDVGRGCHCVCVSCVRCTCHSLSDNGVCPSFVVEAWNSCRSSFLIQRKVREKGEDGRKGRLCMLVVQYVSFSVLLLTCVGMTMITVVTLTCMYIVLTTAGSVMCH